MAALRIAFVRGPNLNVWELQNVDGLQHELVAFGSYAGQFESRGLEIPIRRLPSVRDAVAHAPPIAMTVALRFGGSLDYLAGLERALRGFDIAHVADLVNPYSAQAVRARDAGACKRVVATIWENIAFPVPENALVARRTARVAAGADHFIAITDRARLHLEVAGVPEDRITVQPMGIDLERFRPGTAEREEGPLRVLCVSRLVAEKGVEDLVLAVRLLRDRGVEIRLRLVGQGPAEERLREQARALRVDDAVELAGTLAYGDVPAAYQAADVFVLASGPRTTWREQFGFAIVEAMASGLPVVAGHSGSLPEVVADQDSLVVPHDPQALADSLARLAGDPDGRRRQGERNRAWAEERYDRREVCRRMGSLYEHVMDAPPRVAQPGR